MAIVKKILTTILFISLIFLFGRQLVLAQTETPTLTPALSPTLTPDPTSTDSNSSTSDDSQVLEDLQNKINDLQGKISDLQGQAKTLSSQISVMTNQIQLTEYRVESTKQQIDQLDLDIGTATKKISGLENSLNSLTKVLLNRIVTTYEIGTVQPFGVLLASDNVSNFFKRLNYLKIAQVHDKRLIYDTTQAKSDYVNQKVVFEDKRKQVESLKKQLESYSLQLDQEKQSKQALLDVTHNDEQRYQKLLRDAQAQIQGFKSFSLSKTGGAVSILPPQPSPDGWYYNQRDERWGRSSIGGSSEQVWDVGCLLTSVAMVMKKHGASVTPADVAANSSYFFSDTAYMLLPWGGGRFTTYGGFSQSTVDSKLAGGEVVIVGVRAGAYGMHFIVLKSGSNGDYIMNDPWHGPDLKFIDYYSTGQIFDYGLYNG